MSVSFTRPSDESERDLCERKGWKVGDFLEGTEGGPEWSITAVIELLYIGPHIVVARQVERNGSPYVTRERSWTLMHRDWVKVIR